MRNDVLFNLHSCKKECRGTGRFDSGITKSVGGVRMMTLCSFGKWTKAKEDNVAYLAAKHVNCLESIVVGTGCQKEEVCGWVGMEVAVQDSGTDGEG